MSSSPIRTSDAPHSTAFIAHTISLHTYSLLHSTCKVQYCTLMLLINRPIATSIKTRFDSIRKVNECQQSPVYPEALLLLFMYIFVFPCAHSSSCRSSARVSWAKSGVRYDLRCVAYSTTRYFKVLTFFLRLPEHSDVVHNYIFVY